MTYRRDLLDVPAVVRHAGSQGNDAPPRRVAAASAATLAAPPRSAAPLRPTAPQPPASHVPRPNPPTETGGPRDVILVKTALKQVAVRLSEVTFVEAARNYVQIHLESGTVLKSRVPISRLAGHLGSGRFLRIHRGRIVNVDHVKFVTNVPGSRLTLSLSDGSSIVVARDRRQAVLKELERAAATSRALQ